jgi:hypothetical protein
MAASIRSHNEETRNGLWMEKKLVDMLENNSNARRKRATIRDPGKTDRGGKKNGLLSRLYTLVRA